MRSARLLRAAASLAQAPAVIFVVALLARWRVLWQLLPQSAWRFFYEYNEFARIAWALASGYGYSSPWAHTPLLPTAHEPPVYTFLLAGIFKLAGAYSYASLWIGVGLNAIASAFTGILILRIGRRVVGTPAAILAAWMWSCWLYEAVVSIRLWESGIAALLLMLALGWLPDLAESTELSQWLWFGALAGISALTNTTLLSLFPFFWLWLCISHRRCGRSCYRLLAGSVLVCLLVLLPWTIRNFVTFHRLMPLRDNFGLELWIGNHEGVNQSQQFPREFPLIDPSEYNRMGEIAFMESKRALALAFIGRNPGLFSQLCAHRAWKFWTTPEYSAWPLLSALAWLGGALALWRKRLAAVPYVTVLLIFPLVYYITHTFPTYRHPIEPVILLLAAYAVTEAVQTLTRKGGSSKTGSLLDSDADEKQTA